MAISLDVDQAKLVQTKKKPVRPKYYNAEIKSKVEISEDFEAFLILLGRKKTKDTIKWLTQATKFAVYDGDRDALISQLINNDIVDSSHRYIELRPIVRSFETFRTGFNISGFEGVPECGLLLSDLQLAMSEIKVTGDRLMHQQLWGNLLLNNMISKGMTKDRTRELKSWSSPLSAY